MKPLYLLSGLLFFSTLLSAQTYYASKTIKAHSSQEDTKTSGKVLPSTPLEIIKKDGDKALVKLTGWNQNGLHRVMYFSKGKRIISAVFAKSAKYDLNKLESTTINGKSWDKVTITTWVDNKGLDKKIEPLYKKANDLYQTNCTVCHPAPDVNHFDANQWPSIMKDMGKNTALSKDDLLLITQYLQKHTHKK